MARTESKTPIWGVIAVLALLAVGANFLLRILSDPASGMDFSIYRLGAMTIFDNEGFTQDLYSPTLNDHGVIKPPFTYPPFAAMLFLPFAFMPLVVGKVLMVLGSVVVAWWLSTIIYNYVNARGRELPLQRYFGRVGTIAVLTLLVVAAGPWQRTIDLIQINPFITALILADFVRPATRVPRGVLIGIAGGVKLTPLVFGLILLVRRDWKGIATLGATFFATIALGFILMPKEAPEFWFAALTNPSRVGGLNYVDNISIQGWLLHFGLSEGAAKPVYYALALVSIVLTAGLLYQLERRGAALAQVAVTASLMVALSPISWSHHNVLLPPAGGRAGAGCVPHLLRPAAGLVARGCRVLRLGCRAGPVYFPDAYRLVDARLHGRHGAPGRRCAGGVGDSGVLPVGDDDALVGCRAERPGARREG